jgi:hypothetical protein
MQQPFLSVLLRVIPFLTLSMLSACGGGALNNSPAAPTPQTQQAPSAQPSSTSPPSNSTVFDNIQQWAGWLTCGNCGNTGATGATATYQMTQGITAPAESGDSAEFWIGGNYAYSNAYWYYAHPPRSSGMSSLVYEFDLYVPAAAASAPQAIEFECQQRLSGYTYNFAWQADYVSDHWRVFNYTAKQWESSGIVLQRFAPDTWHHIIAEYHNDAVAHVTYHDALTVDGVRYVVNLTHPATPTSAADQFTNAFQLDLNSTPVAYSVYVDKMRVTQVD